MTLSLRQRPAVTYDPAGTRTVLERQARSGESISVEAPYRQECVVSVYLGGDLVWQEKRQ